MQTLMVFPDFHWVPTEKQLWTILTLLWLVRSKLRMTVTAEQVQVTSRGDPVLSQVFCYIQDG